MPQYTYAVGDRTLVVSCADALERQAQWLLQVLQGMHRQDWHDGQRIQLGWSLLTLRARDREWLVSEPDFNRNPALDTHEDLTTTLTVLACQVAVLARAGIAVGVPARFDEAVTIAKGYLSEQRLYLERRTPKENDSGWYIGPVEGPPLEALTERFQRLPVYSLLQQRPGLLPLLALPPGYLVVINGDAIEGAANADNQEVWRKGD